MFTATQVKQANPNATVIVWLDSFRIYTANKLLNPDLKLPCTTGHFFPAQFLETGGKMGDHGDPKSVYLLKNASGLPALELWSGCHMFDHTQAVARDYWTDMCLNLTLTGVIDGCGADASWQNGVDQAKDWGLTPAMARAWGSGHEQMMRNTTAMLGPAGILLGKDPWEVGDCEWLRCNSYGLQCHNGTAVDVCLFQLLENQTCWKIVPCQNLSAIGTV